MAIIKAKEAAKMNDNELNEKLKDLKLELVKSKIAAKKTGKGQREIRRTIARLLTFKKLNEIKNKK